MFMGGGVFLVYSAMPMRTAAGVGLETLCERDGWKLVREGAIPSPAAPRRARH